ncbi:glycosyltransferase [Falsirhodobacter sp. 20TX0035]|uniref:glycosyltransferase n=1 Tax=Falsirhodobacter sp. 20TX0035 TaxID=3022019 RepID=UPI00232F6723|nr:glycosyltransferase [Falsirhodobacter sp. 20TX0035]MDB6454794.1 glycosyltransferase [Falsirhodobacter sp. 20TX0035]
MLVTYLAHDLDDPAISRRVEMLRRGGAEVRLAGFRRGSGALAPDVTVLGQTENGRMKQRLASILRALPRIGRMVPPAARPETILARNLETLVLGAWLARGGRARLCYELLDIHGMMLGQGKTARALRQVEATLMRRCAAVVTSSPAFARNYLRAYGQPDIPVILAENKPFDGPATKPATAPARAPVTIGWFGILRCRFSLDALDRLTRRHPGQFQVILRGRPALDVLGDFQAVVDANPDLHFLGPYRWPDDLPAIYGEVDYAWLIDRYQAGENSDWLLPNRLYEGCLNGAVPIVLEGTEVARKAAGWGCTLTIRAPKDDAIAEGLANAAGDLPALQQALAAVPRDALRMDDAECRSLTAAICGGAA